MGIGGALAAAAAMFFEVDTLDVHSSLRGFVEMTILAMDVGGLILLAVLTGNVLKRKFHLFPRGEWISRHAFMGILYAGLSATPALMWHPYSDVLDALNDPEFVAATFFIGPLVGAGVGLTQAWTLVDVARNLKVWIGYAALAGVTVPIFTPVFVYGLRLGVPPGLLVEVVVVMIIIAAAFIMRSAVRALQPA